MVLVLDHCRSNRHWSILWTGTGPTVPVISVGGMFPHCHQHNMGGCSMYWIWLVSRHTSASTGHTAAVL